MHYNYPLNSLLSKISSGIFFATTFFFSSGNAQAQKIEVWQGAVKQPYNSTVAFPPAAETTPSLSFIIKNAGDSDLQLTGEPLVRLNKVIDFFLTEDPSASVIKPGDSSVFSISYFPSSGDVNTARIFISSNDPDNETFIMNLAGPGSLLYTSLNQWPGTVDLQSFGDAGYSGGVSVNIENVKISGKTGTYWGPVVDSDGRLSLSLTYDGFAVSDDEVMKFSPEESSLDNGILVWKGKSILIDAIDGTSPIVYTRATLRTSKGGGAAFPLVSPAILGLPAQIGGLIKFSSDSEKLEANLLVEASFSPDTDYMPYQEFYETKAIPADPTSAYFIGKQGFYWYNLSPAVENNVGLVVNEGGKEIINSELLNIYDESSSESITFYFDPTLTGDNPVKNETGYLVLKGDTLKKSDSFTLKDLEDGNLSFVHNGGDAFFQDEFAFSVKDGKDAISPEIGSSLFTFKIEIDPVNDLPVAKSDTIYASYKGSYSGQLKASDPEENNLTFEIVDQPLHASVSVKEDGSFIYTSNSGSSGTDFFTFRVNDGFGFSNLASVIVNLINAAPYAKSEHITTKENVDVSGKLTASDAENGNITFSIVAEGNKGKVEITDEGDFIYKPDGNLFGTDVFFFKAIDDAGNESPATAYYVHIKPSLDEGDVLIADVDKIRIIDAVTSQDSIIASGEYIKDARNIYYKNGTSLFVLDAESGLIKINPETGLQTLLVEVTRFSMLPSDPLAPAMIMDRDGNLVMADGMNGVVRIDTATGFVESVYQGGDLQFASGILQLRNGDLIVGNGGVFFGAPSSILKISPNSSVVTISSGNDVLLPLDIALKDQNNIYVADGGSLASGTDAVYKLNLTDGTKEQIADAGDLNWPAGIDFQQKQELLYVVSQGNKSLFQYNANGTKSTISVNDGLVNPFGLFVIQRTNLRPDFNAIEALSGKFGTVYRINLDTVLTDDVDPLNELLVDVESSDRSVVDVSVDGSIITLICLGSGSADVFIKATDTDGAYSLEEFKVYVDREIQYITFDPIPDKSITSTDFTIVANSNAQLPVTFEALSSNVIVEGDKVQIIGPGMAKIKAKQEGNDEFAPAIPVIRSFCVAPGQPEITQAAFEDGTILLNSSDEEGNQWYFNNQPIEGEVSKSLLATKTGFYGVKTVIEGCEGEMSVLADVLITGISSKLSLALVQVFPVPADNQITVHLENAASETRMVEVLDVLGQIVYTTYSNQETIEINIENLSSGQYLLKLSTAEGLITKRFIKR
ncbi:MAG: T9SS type A sorting domain-containing protein [Sporocytophaga sp.]|uniref:Ig-like domain-containing protein n=1 Tax=Sporocytophaga sp. TaxID=2231183 RepID=UPI001B1A0B65|nr:Ig-like domain-containing protein [Sporocytophaga sp.]MBO9698688.1 T9SS type A sorting domain-containing protein [Sporocytophaga sp.]